MINQHVGYGTVMQVFNELSVSSWSSISALNECIGDIDEDHSNSIMEAEMESQRGGGNTGEASDFLSQHHQAIQAMHTGGMGSHDTACCLEGYTASLPSAFDLMNDQTLWDTVSTLWYTFDCNSLGNPQVVHMQCSVVDLQHLISLLLFVQSCTQAAGKNV